MIFVTHNHPSLRFPRKETFRAVKSVLLHEGVADIDLSVVFVGSRFIRRLNKKFLRHDYVTDVLAFPLEGRTQGVLEGEIYINLDRARSQARTFGVSYSDETRRLVVHGTLHLLGYSDSTARKKKRMTQCEDQVLASLSSS